MSEVRVTDPVTGGQKGQKPERYDLLPYEALDEVARVYSFGAAKYDDDNWRKGYAYRLSLGALGRHMSRYAQGENLDPESGLHHLAHAAFHCLTLIAFHKLGRGTDDRAEAKPKKVVRPAKIKAGGQELPVTLQRTVTVEESPPDTTPEMPPVLQVGAKVRVVSARNGNFGLDGREGIIEKVDANDDALPWYVDLGGSKYWLATQDLEALA